MVQAHGCGVIWGLAEGKVAQDAVGGHGGISAVLDAARRHPGKASVQEEACGAIFGLSCGNREFQGGIVEGGGLELILEAQATQHLDRIPYPCPDPPRMAGYDGAPRAGPAPREWLRGAWGAPGVP